MKKSFVEVANEIVLVEGKLKGLANDFLVCTQSVFMAAIAKDPTCTVDEILVEYDKAITQAEVYVRESVEAEYGEGVTLSDASPNWRNYKSVCRGAIKDGMNPTEYGSFSKLRAAKIDASKKKKNVSKEVPEVEAQVPTAGDNVTAMPVAVESQSPYAEKLSALAKLLAELPLDEAEACLEGAINNAAARKRRVGRGVVNMK